MDFHLILEDKLRQSKTSYQRKKLKLNYQKAIRMTTTAPRDPPGYRKCTEEGSAHEALHMSIVTKFWLSSVNTFEVLYEAVFTSVYSRQGKAKLTPQVAKHCLTKFLESFPGLSPFTQLTLVRNDVTFFCNIIMFFHKLY